MIMIIIVSIININMMILSIMIMIIIGQVRWSADGKQLASGSEDEYDDMMYHTMLYYYITCHNIYHIIPSHDILHNIRLYKYTGCMIYHNLLLSLVFSYFIFRIIINIYVCVYIYIYIYIFNTTTTTTTNDNNSNTTNNHDIDINDDNADNNTFGGRDAEAVACGSGGSGRP